MLGIVIAVIVAAWSVLIGGNALEAGFLSAAGFLWTWYLIWTVVIGLFLGFITLVVTGAVTAVSAETFGSRMGGLVGFAGAGSISLIILTRVAITRALLLGGAYLLMNAGTPLLTFAQFSTNNLIFGTLLLVLGLLLSRVSSSSSSDD